MNESQLKLKSSFISKTKVRPMFSMAMIGICVLFAISIAKDTIKFVKNIKDVEKEN